MTWFLKDNFRAYGNPKFQISPEGKYYTVKLRI